MGSRVSFGRRRCRCWRGGGRRCCRRATSPGGGAAPPGGSKRTVPGSARERDVLLAVELVSNRGSHAAAQAGLDVEKLLALVGAVSHQVSVGNNLEDKISRCRDRAAADAPAAGRDPSACLRDRIPGDQRAALDALRRFRPDGRAERSRFLSGTMRPFGPKNGGMPMFCAPGFELELRIDRE